MLIRNAAWAFGAQVFRAATVLILIAVLDPVARGYQSLLVLLPTLLATVSLLGIGSATPVILHRCADERRLLANLIGLALCVLVVMTMLLALSGSLLARYLSDPKGYSVTSQEVLLGMLLLPPTLLGDYIRAFLSARRDLRQVALSQSIQAGLQLLLSVLLVFGFGLGPLGAVWAIVLGAWAGLGWTMRSVRAWWSFPPRLDGDVLRPLLGLGLRAHVGNLIQTFNYRLDVLIVQGLLGHAAVGLYQTSVALAELVWYVPNAVGAALLTQIAAAGASTITPRVTRHTLLLTIVTSITLISIVVPALAFLRPVYLPAVAPLCALLPGIIALSIHKVISGDLAGRGRPEYATYTSFLALFVTVIGNIILIPRWGILGAAYASSCAYIVQALALVVLFTRSEQVRWQELLIPSGDDVRYYRTLVLRARQGWH
jgi:O-antigen/teichoic acid export membrane protein